MTSTASPPQSPQKAAPPKSAQKPKPTFTAPPPSSDLLSRLNAFLPALRAANEELVAAPESHNIEAVADDEQYIEMNLGLGVLEEVKRDSGSESDSDSDSGSEGESGGERDNILAAILKASRRDAKKESSKEGEEGEKVAEEGVLAEIMGKKQEGRKVGIEVMDEDEDTK